MTNVVDFDLRSLTIEPIVDNLEEGLEIAMPMLMPAIERYGRNVDIEDVEDDLIALNSLLWIVYTGGTAIAAFTTCVVRHPKRKTLMIEFMGGKHMSLWMQAAINVLREVAKKGKLDAIEADGRTGFSRIAAANGFKETHRHFEMEI